MCQEPICHIYKYWGLGGLQQTFLEVPNSAYSHDSMFNVTLSTFSVSLLLVPLCAHPEQVTIVLLECPSLVGEHIVIFYSSTQESLSLGSLLSPSQVKGFFLGPII